MCWMDARPGALRPTRRSAPTTSNCGATVLVTAATAIQNRMIGTQRISMMRAGRDTDRSVRRMLPAHAGLHQAGYVSVHVVRDLSSSDDPVGGDAAPDRRTVPWGAQVGVEGGVIGGQHVRPRRERRRPVGAGARSSRWLMVAVVPGEPNTLEQHMLPRGCSRCSAGRRRWVLRPCWWSRRCRRQPVDGEADQGDDDDRHDERPAPRSNRPIGPHPSLSPNGSRTVRYRTTRRNGGAEGVATSGMR